MCGVAGYVGKKNGKQLILDMLSKLQYRGHDGAGFACLNNKKISLIKEAGTIELLKKKMHYFKDDGNVAIGHIRWASVGESSWQNAHPIANDSGNIAFVHGGNITNYMELKNDLIKKGYHFSSQTDTQVVPYLLDYYMSKHDNLKLAIIKVIKKLQGSFALVGLTEHYPDTLITIRKRSPISVIFDDESIRISSDFRALGADSDKGFFQSNETFGILGLDEMNVYNFSGQEVAIDVQNITAQEPVYGMNELNKTFEHITYQLQHLLQSIFPDREIPRKYAKLSVLANTLLQGTDLDLLEQKRVQSLLLALDHLQEGTYGLCFHCGQALSEQVTALYPHASLCPVCYQRFEAFA